MKSVSTIHIKTLSFASFLNQSVSKSYENFTCSAIARSFAASVSASSRTAAIVPEEIEGSIGGGGNDSCSSAKETCNIYNKAVMRASIIFENNWFNAIKNGGSKSILIPTLPYLLHWKP